MTLKLTRTKTQLISIIYNELLDDFTKTRCQKQLIITTQDDAPIYTRNGLHIKMQDIKATHEVADIIIPKQVRKAMDDGKRNVKIICDNTGVVILPLYYY